MTTEVQEAIEATATPAPDPAPPAAPAPAPTEQDPDAAALAAVKADIAAGKTDEASAAPNAETPPPAAQAQPAAPAAPKPPQVVPAAALLAERRRAQQAEMEAAELRGRVSVLETLNRPTDPNAPTPPAPAETVDRVTAIDQEIDALAERFDRGDITMKEFKAQERALLNEQQTIRSQAQQYEAVANDGGLKAHSEQLMRDYPIVSRLNAAQVDALTQMAYADAALEGKPIGQGVDGTKDLRTRIAVLAQSKFGQPAAGSAPPAQPAPTRQMQQTAAALEKAQAAPPDVSQMGSASTANLPSETEVLAQLDRMNDDEANAYLNSMPGLRAKIRGFR